MADMNSNITLGAITFLVWSGLSSWYYVCDIKGQCDQPEEMAVVTTVDPNQKTTSTPSTEVVTPIKEEKSEAINIVEDQIFFDINSSTFLDQTYVDGFLTDLKASISDRQVEISIEGFTCDLGNTKYNTALGQRRAQALQSYMSNLGFSNIKISSGGEISSINGSDEERAQHRKVSITIKSIDS